jgi:DNA-binding MarR family transcriptional regulator
MKTTGGTVSDRTPTDEDLRQGAWQLMIAAVHFGEAIGEGVARRAADGSLAYNAPLSVITELALRGPRRPSQLATFTGLTSGGVTKLLDRMETDGIIVRREGEITRDRRAVVVRLSDKGEQLAALIADVVLDQVGLLRAFSAELTGLLDLMDDHLAGPSARDGLSRRRRPSPRGPRRL